MIIEIQIKIVIDNEDSWNEDLEIISIYFILEDNKYLFYGIEDCMNYDCYEEDCPIENDNDIEKTFQYNDYSFENSDYTINGIEFNDDFFIMHNLLDYKLQFLNGIDAVVLSTGNDFRAIEAGIHTYASRSGEYQGLTDIKLEDDTFEFSIEVPLTLGTVGGLTSLHPLAKISLNMLGNPSAKELMKIVACVGLAQNFSAIKSLVTTGIQKGHMKMHLMNILNHLKATEEEFEIGKKYFLDKVVSFNAVREFLASRRRYH